MSLARSKLPSPDPIGAGVPAVTAAAESLPLIVIEAGVRSRGLGLAEIWPYRELLCFLVWRDLKVRYKQTVLGVAWAVLQPLLNLIVFTLVFGRLGGIGKQLQVPYPVFACAGILLWGFFSSAVSQGGQSLIGSSQLVSKVYFPRLIVPFAAVGGTLVDLGLACVLALALLIGYRVPLGPRALLFPCFVVTAIIAAAGCATLLAALTVSYRDFRHLSGFLIQAWMFVSPVGYPLASIPAEWRLVYALNPMVGPIAGARAALLGETFAWGPIAVSSVSALALLLAALVYFRRAERRFADII